MTDEDEIKRVERMHANSAAIFEHMGRLASDWAVLEVLINDCIWRLAEVTPTAGACITAQIFNVTNRLHALIALMELRGFPDRPLIKQMRQFANDVREPAERRNRVIHDPVFMAPETGQVARLEITAQRKPVAEMKVVTEDALLSARRAVYNACQDFMVLRGKIIAQLPSLPPLPKTSALPIDLRLVQRSHDEKREP